MAKIKDKPEKVPIILKKKPILNHRFIFKIISIGIPFVVLIVLELLLRILHFGFNPSLFIKDPKLSGYYSMNPEVGRLFFVNFKDVPAVLNEPFTKEKPDNTYRIFVLGESTAIGYPYIPNGSFHRMLKYRLDRTFTDLNIEIINLSMTAINSYALLTFTGEIIKMNPDAVLIYAGHNEYYGALGVASHQRLGLNRWVIKVIICLKKLRIIQVAFQIQELINNLFSTKAGINNNGLMQRLGEKQEVVFDSKLFHLGLIQFEQNMDELIQKYYFNHIPVYLANIVSNERGQKPFISKLSITSDTTKFKKLYHNGLEAYEKGDLNSAMISFISANEIDSSYALINFLLGEIYYQISEYTNAKRYYNNAKELDALRFRAPEGINTIILNLSQKYNNVYLVDVKKEFTENSDHSILDNELFLEHLHPTLLGYFLISDAFYSALKNTRMFGNWNNIISRDSILKDLPLTAIDSIYGTLEIMQLRERWPFYEHTDYKKIIHNTYPEELVGNIFVGKMNWASAMIALFNYYEKNNRTLDALRVLKGLELQYSYDWHIAHRVGSLCLKLNYYNESLLYFKKAFSNNPDVKIAKQIVINLLYLNKLEESKEYLKFIIKNNPTDKLSLQMYKRIEDVINYKRILSNEPENFIALYTIADFYLHFNKIDEAKIYIEKALSLNVKETDSLQMLNDLINLMKNKH